MSALNDLLIVVALAFDVIDVTRLKKMLGSAAQHDARDEGGAKVVALPVAAPRFARPKGAFATQKGAGAGNKEGA